MALFHREALAREMERKADGILLAGAAWAEGRERKSLAETLRDGARKLLRKDG